MSVLAFQVNGQLLQADKLLGQLSLFPGTGGLLNQARNRSTPDAGLLPLRQVDPVQRGHDSSLAGL